MYCLILSPGVEPAHRAHPDLGRLQGFGPGDRRVLLLDHQVLAGDVVRPGERHPLLAGGVDGVGGGHHVDGALLDLLLPHARRRLDPGDPAVGDAELGDDDLGDLDVEALGLARQALEAEEGLVELRADRDLLGGVEGRHGGAGLELRLLAAGGAVVLSSSPQPVRARPTRRTRTTGIRADRIPILDMGGLSSVGEDLGEEVPGPVALRVGEELRRGGLLRRAGLRP